MKPTLLILAAGIGSRYGGLKQVDGIGPGGEAIIEYSIFDAIRAGFGKVVFVIRHNIEEAFKAKFAGRFNKKIKVEYVFQEVNTPIEGLQKFPDRQKPWGTGHAVLMAERVINEPFAVINADDYYGISGFKSMAGFLTRECSPSHYGMIAYVLTNTLSENGAVSRGVCEMDENNFLTQVLERHQIQRNAERIYYETEDGTKYPLKDNELVSMNFWGFHHHIFPAIRSMFISFVKENGENPKSEFYIPLVVNRLLESGEIKLSVLPNDEQWYGITFQEDKIPVQSAFAKLAEEEKYPIFLWE